MTQYGEYLCLKLNLKLSVTLSISLPVAVEKVGSSPSDAENTNMWIIIGVVIPLLVVIVIISILYWKLCRTDKLEFQPDAMTSIQQRQKVESDQCLQCLASCPTSLCQCFKVISDLHFIL